MQDPRIKLTSRIQNYLDNPDRGTLPVSCTTIKPSKSSVTIQLQETIKHSMVALATAAGVNVHLDNFDFFGVNYDVGDMVLALSEDHPDYSKWCHISTNILKSKYSRYLVIKLQDSLRDDPNEDGNQGIVNGLIRAINHALLGYNIAVDFTNLRPEGTKTNRVVSSGPASFSELFDAGYRLAQNFTVTNLLGFLGKINLVIRRGGVYKNGAITTSLPLWHFASDEYINCDPPTDHPGLQKGLVIPFNYDDYPRVILDAIDAVNYGSLWLEKALDPETRELLRSDDPRVENRLLANVCREVFPENRGTCMLSPVNLGQCVNDGDIKQAMTKLMRFLCELHKKDLVTGDLADGIYLSSEEDKQVGLGYIGLANLLAYHKISYSLFIRTLKGIVNNLYDYNSLDFYTCHQLPAYGVCSKVEKLCLDLVEGVLESARIAKSYGMVRAFAIAPTASISYKGKDVNGYTTTPEISPPISNFVERVSPLGSDVYQYPDDVEVASKVEFDAYFELADVFMSLHDYTGLNHSYSFNLWEDIDLDFIDKWLNSSIPNTYYRLNIESDYLDKSGENLVCSMDGHCTACDEG